MVGCLDHSRTALALVTTSHPLVSWRTSLVELDFQSLIRVSAPMKPSASRPLIGWARGEGYRSFDSSNCHSFLSIPSFDESDADETGGCVAGNDATGERRR